MSKGEHTVLDEGWDEAVTKSASRYIKKLLKVMQKHDPEIYDFLSDMIADGNQDLTEEQEREVIEALSKYGLTQGRIPRQKILDAFLKAKGVNLFNQNEIDVPIPGIIVLTNESAALAMSRMPDPTPDPKPPAFAREPE